MPGDRLQVNRMHRELRLPADIGADMPADMPADMQRAKPQPLSSGWDMMRHVRTAGAPQVRREGRGVEPRVGEVVGVHAHDGHGLAAQLRRRIVPAPMMAGAS